MHGGTQHDPCGEIGRVHPSCQPAPATYLSLSHFRQQTLTRPGSPGLLICALHKRSAVPEPTDISDNTTTTILPLGAIHRLPRLFSSSRRAPRKSSGTSCLWVCYRSSKRVCSRNVIGLCLVLLLHLVLPHPYQDCFEGEQLRAELAGMRTVSLLFSVVMLLIGTPL